MKKILFLLAFIAIENVNAQFFKKHHHEHDTTDLTYTGTFNPYAIEYDTTGSVQFSGYISTYYSHYSDKEDLNGFQRFEFLVGFGLWF
jgi:hypothetical protein